MVKHFALFFFVQALVAFNAYSQREKSMFKDYSMQEVPDNRFGEIHISNDGSVLVSATAFSFAMISDAVYSPFMIGLSRTYHIKGIKNVFHGDPMIHFAESSDRNIFFANSNNQISFFKNTETGYCDLAPFHFPLKGESPKAITKLWFDGENNLYIGVKEGAFYVVPKAGANPAVDSSNYTISSTKDSAMVILKGELPVRKIKVDKTGAVNCFAYHRTSRDFVWVGTDNGLYKYDKKSSQVSSVFSPETKITITDIEVLANGDIWFSTLEKGMGVYSQVTASVDFYPYPKTSSATSPLYPIQNFCTKSPAEFFVAVKDSFPAIFNITSHRYTFITDSFNAPHFAASKNATSDIKVDTGSNFFFIKGGILYSANVGDRAEWVGETALTKITTPLIYQLKDLNKRLVADYYFQSAYLKKIVMRHNQNSLIVYYTSNNFSVHKRTQFAWKLEGSDVSYWYEMPLLSNDNDSVHIAELINLKPGKYTLRVKMRPEDGVWNPNEARLEILVKPPYWKTAWFWLVIAGGLLLVVYTILRLRVRAVRKEEKIRAQYQHELLELEAKALRAQMNPHFVFNCLNSIKALMQDKETEKGVTYLTTFSKLIRTLFNNADKKQISLYDEMETCKLYLQLEAMRFDTKFSYAVKVDETIDLKSINVPALIIQPFIENAIWHGIIPNGEGHVVVSVAGKDDSVVITIDDNGIGREASLQNKSAARVGHQSKGVNLTKSRLELDNLLQQRQATLTINDKKDDSGQAAGTEVVITLNREV